MSYALTALIAFLLGVLVTLRYWDRAAQRGHFEIGGVIYKVEVFKP